MIQDAVLLIGAGPLQSCFIKEAQQLGLKVVCTDGNKNAIGSQIADDFYVADCYNAEKTFSAISFIQKKYNLRGVACCGIDVAPTVAYVAEQLGLPGIPSDVARRTHNKLAVRQCLHTGFRDYQPNWAAWKQGQYAALPGYTTFPVVMKPLQQRASRGISIAHDADEALLAIEKAYAYNGTHGTILIEELLTGTEHSCEVIFDVQGQVVWQNIVDRPFDYTTGVPIELGHINPTCLAPAQQEAIYEMVFEVAHAVGVNFGPFKVDVMLADSGPKVLEVTARLSGGWDCQRTSPLTGRHPMRQALQIACGLPVEAQPLAQGYAACAAILPQKTGRVRLPNNFAQTVWMVQHKLCEVIWMVQNGDVIHPAQHNGERCGFILAYAQEYAAAWEQAKVAAEMAAEMLEVE